MPSAVQCHHHSNVAISAKTRPWGSNDLLKLIDFHIHYPVGLVEHVQLLQARQLYAVRH